MPETFLPETTGPTNQTQTRKRLPLLFGLLIIFLLMKLALLMGSTGQTASASDLTALSILQAVNRERTLRNLTELSTNAMLGTAAQGKADDMIVRHYFSHTDPEGNYIWPKITEAGYSPYLQLGENLAIEFYNTESLVAAWMNSPTHRANILNEGFKDQGMGLSFGDTTAGQYHSAIANTFGALQVKSSSVTQKTQIQPQATKTNSQPEPAEPTALPAENEPLPLPSKTEEPQTEQQKDQLYPRGYAMSEKKESQQPGAPTATPANSTAPAVQRTNSASPVESYKLNRYFTLAFGILFLLFLLTDLHAMAEKKWESAAGKISNLVVLLIAIIVIAVMYWL